IDTTPKSRQTLLFSATYPEDIQTLSARFQRDAAQIRVASQHDNRQIEQHFYLCQKAGKRQALQVLLSYHAPDAAVIFCNTKEAAREVSDYLNASGNPALALHGDLEQRERDQVLV